MTRRTPSVVLAIHVVLGAGLAVLPAACGQAQGQAPTAQAGPPRIALVVGASGSATIDVTGLPPDTLARLSQSALARDEWERLLRVRVGVDGSNGASTGGSQAAANRSDQPAVLGRYGVADGALRFTPQFPFEPGTAYDVELDLDALAMRTGGEDEAVGSGAGTPPGLHRLNTTVRLPVPERRGAATRVTAVYPSAAELPENQLRMYVTFSQPMGLRDGAPYIQLLDEQGQPVVDPFLPLDVNLWNEDRTRYTLLFDPGRQKSGILPNEQMGRSLVEGRRYTLTVDAGWPDAAGQRLAEPYRHQFRVGPAVERAIAPPEWRVDVPAEGTRDPLALAFPRPLDYGLLQSAIRLVADPGQVVAGELRLESNETRWLFTPRDAWKAGAYRVLVAETLEDVAGNRIGRPFEVSMLHVTSGPGAPRAAGAELPFTVRPRGR